MEVAEKLPAKSLAETAKEKTALSETMTTVEVAVVALTALLLLIIKLIQIDDREPGDIQGRGGDKTAVGRQKTPGIGKWKREEIVGGVVSGAEEELDEDEELAFQKMNWRNWRTTTSPPLRRASWRKMKLPPFPRRRGKPG